MLAHLDEIDESSELCSRGRCTTVNRVFTFPTQVPLIAFHAKYLWKLLVHPTHKLVLTVGVRDRELRRRSFRLGEEPGRLALAIEVVSKKSLPKDYRDILDICEVVGYYAYVNRIADGLGVPTESWLPEDPA